VLPIHVAAYIEELQQRIAAPSVKVQLAAIRMLVDWLVRGQVVPTNPAIVVRGQKYVVKKGKSPILSADEACTLLDSIDIHRHASPRIGGLRDRVMIALEEYIVAVGITDDPNGWLFRTTEGQSGYLTDRPMSQVDGDRIAVSTSASNRDKEQPGNAID
jgi:hypothetical protein